MNNKNLAMTLATVVFLVACDAGDNSYIKLRSYNSPDYLNHRKVGANYSQTNFDKSYVASSCKEFMQYEMGFPHRAKWSSVEDITETTSGWQWRGWVDVYGERSNFVCNIDKNNHEVIAFTHKENYPHHFPNTLHENNNKTNAGNVVSSCKEFMQYEMGFPHSVRWSSAQNVTKTIEGWQWQGWVDIYGERNKFVCTIDNNGVRVATNFEDSESYEYEINFPYNPDLN